MNLVWKMSFSELLHWLFGHTCMYLIKLKPEAFFDWSLQAQATKGALKLQNSINNSRFVQIMGKK